jgi:hypothetical protein
VTHWCCRARPARSCRQSTICSKADPPHTPNNTYHWNSPCSTSVSTNTFVTTSARCWTGRPQACSFSDITPLLQDAKVFRVLIDAFVHRYMDPHMRPDVVAGLDARGFILGAVVAYELG